MFVKPQDRVTLSHINQLSQIIVITFQLRLQVARKYFRLLENQE